MGTTGRGASGVGRSGRRAARTKVFTSASSFKLSHWKCLHLAYAISRSLGGFECNGVYCVTPFIAARSGATSKTRPRRRSAKVPLEPTGPRRGPVASRVSLPSSGALFCSRSCCIARRELCRRRGSWLSAEGSRLGRMICSP